MTRAVLFDFYGTVAHAVTWGPERQAVLAANGYQVPESVQRRWGAENLDGLEHLQASRSRDDYRAWERERLRAMVEECGVGPDDAERLVEEFDAASQAFTMAAFPEVADVLGALRDQGILVAVCSNWTWDLDRAIDQAGIAGLIDVLVSSARVGARKPHPRIFEHTLAACDVAAADALFVGDSVVPDVVGPLAVGIRSVHVWRNGGATAPDNGAPDNGAPDNGAPDNGAPPLPAGAHRVADLRGVLGLVGRRSGGQEAESHPA